MLRSCRPPASSPTAATRSQLRADRTHVLRDVRRAAKRMAAVEDADDGNGRFRRDTLDFTAQVHVEHRIADDGDAFR